MDDAILPWYAYRKWTKRQHIWKEFFFLRSKLPYFWINSICSHLYIKRKMAGHYWCFRCKQMIISSYNSVYLRISSFNLIQSFTGLDYLMEEHQEKRKKNTFDCDAYEMNVCNWAKEMSRIQCIRIEIQTKSEMFALFCLTPWSKWYYRVKKLISVHFRLCDEIKFHRNDHLDERDVVHRNERSMCLWAFMNGAGIHSATQRYSADVVDDDKIFTVADFQSGIFILTFT